MGRTVLQVCGCVVAVGVLVEGLPIGEGDGDDDDEGTGRGVDGR